MARRVVWAVGVFGLALGIAVRADLASPSAGSHAAGPVEAPAATPDGVRTLIYD
jgi:hypothetical protein